MRKRLLYTSLLPVFVAMLTCGEGNLTNPHDPRADVSPDAPSELTAVALSDSEIQLEWRDNGIEAGFAIRRRSEQDSLFQDIGTVQQNITSFHDRTAHTGNVYFYRVIAYTANGKEAFAETSINHVFSAPSHLTLASESPHSIRLAWLNNAKFPVRFRLERKHNAEYVLLDTTSETDYLDESVKLGNSYHYRVAAFTSSNMSCYVEEGILHALLSPTNLSVTPLSVEEIFLQWEDNARFELSYVIEREEEGQGFARIRTLPENSDSYMDTDVLPSVSYTYRVKCTADSTESQYTDERSAVIEFGSPSSLAVESISLNSVRLSWTDNSTVETAFEIERSANGVGYSTVGQLAPNTTEWIDSFLNSAAEYAYRVVAASGTSHSTTSEEIVIIYKPTWLRTLEEAVFDIHFMNTDIGFGVGFSGSVYITSDGGENWQQTTAPTGASMTSVYVLDEQTVWIGGGSALFKSTDGGLSWTAQTLPNGVTMVSDIYFKDSSTGFILGCCALARSTDGGSSWHLPVTSPEDTSRAVYGVSFAASEVGLAVGSKGGIWKTEDGGVSWSGMTLDSNATYHSVSCPVENLGWACGKESRYQIIVCTTDGGTTWQEQYRRRSGSYFPELTSICFVGRNNGWATGSDGVLLRTTNGGTEWLTEDFNVGEDPSFLEKIQFIDAGHGWLGSSESGGGVWTFKARWTRKY